MIRQIKFLDSIRIYQLIIIGLVSFLVAQNSPDSTKSGKNQKLELVRADYIRGVEVQNKVLKVWDGHVHVRQDSLELFCDHATYDDVEKKINLDGNVRLIQGEDTLYTKYLTYYEDSQLAIAEESVQVHRPDQFLYSDYLEYYYQTDRLKARGHLRIIDTKSSVTITAEKGEYLPEEKMTFVEENAHFCQVDSTQKDTLHIYGRRMEYYSGEIKKAMAKDSVRIYQNTLYAYGDSAIYFVDDQIAYLEINPFAFQENNKMFGNQIKLIMKELEVEKIQINGNAQAISIEDSLLGKENQLEGKEIIIFVSEGRLTELWAISNAKSLYHLKEDQEYVGTNSASADTIKAFFKNNELDSIVVIGGAQGTFYP
jgi:lipopolysaccharide export system protein LptA